MHDLPRLSPVPTLVQAVLIRDGQEVFHVRSTSEAEGGPVPSGAGLDALEGPKLGALQIVNKDLAVDLDVACGEGAGCTCTQYMTRNS